MELDWTTLLKAQQADFIERLKYAQLLHCHNKGRHSELTVISDESLDQLRDFCWEMADKYKNTSARKNYINTLKGKLGEEAIKACLGNFITEVDYKLRASGDGKVDFSLTTNPNVKIQVKTRCGDISRVKWSITPKEVSENAALVCVLIPEDISEAQGEYHLIVTGFLPTSLIQESSVGIHNLFYVGGLRGYLESLICSDSPEFLFKPVKSSNQIRTEIRHEHDNFSSDKLYLDVVERMLWAFSTDKEKFYEEALEHAGDTGVMDERLIQKMREIADGYQKRGQEVVANWLRIRSQFLEIALVGLAQCYRNRKKFSDT